MRYRKLLARALALACLCYAASGSAQDAVQRVELHGLNRTRASTVLELLPRPPPAAYSEAELAEFDRRLRNLGIFDYVAVERTGALVRVEVREKWTLVPVVDFSTGSSWEDTYASLSVAEYNFLGLAAQLSGSVWHAERGWNAAVLLQEHNYHPARGSWGMTLEYASAAYFFEDSPDSWDRIGAGGGVLWRAPMPHGTYFGYHVGAGYYYERNLAVTTSYAPPDGHALHAEVELAWDQFSWDDLAPDGLLLTLTLVPGILYTTHKPQARFGASAVLLWAHAFSDTTVLMGQIASDVTNRGNANFSTLIGSFEGVRGLEDAVYRTWLRTSANLEFRQSFRIFERWAVQGVGFVDGAVFERIDSHGGDAGAGSALSVGAGARIIPTFIAELILRIDVARAIWPEPGWVVQWGLSQYF